MKTKVPVIAGAIAAMTLTVSSCSDNHETLTPTAPSAISGPAAEPATPRTTANPTAGAAGVQINDAIPRPGDSLPNTGGTRASNYTYIDGVPGAPRDVRVRPTGVSFQGSIYEVEVTWNPPSWGASNISGILMEVHDGQSVITENRADGPIASPFRGNLPPAEGQFRLSLCNNVGCGPPYGAGSIVIGDAMEKPGPPRMTISPEAQVADELIGARLFKAKVHAINFHWQNTDSAREIQIEYWLRPGKSWRTFNSVSSLQANTGTDIGVVWLMEGSWTVTARLRNSRGWGRRAVKRLNVRVDTRTTKPGTIPVVQWSNGRLRWEAPPDTGGLPILKYEYFRATGCPAGTGTPYPLQRGDRYQLTNQQIRIRQSPDGMSVRAHNRKGAGPCTSTRS